MADSPLTRVDYRRCQRWFNLMAGGEFPVSVFDAQGAPVWGGDGEPGAQLGELLTHAPATKSGVSRLERAGNGAVLYHPLWPEGFEPLGWAAVPVPAERAAQAPLAADRLADALAELAGLIVEEAVRNADLEQMSEELAECYEELHLVYAMDDYVRVGVGDDADMFRKMLASTAEHMGVDVVAFVHPEEDQCLYATSLSKEIHNLDLLLVETRGDLFRFVQASGAPVVLNEMDDPRRVYIFTDMPYRVLACPIRIGAMVKAQVVLLNHLHKPPFTNSDRRLAEVLANQLAAIAKGGILLRDMSNFTEQLAAALVEAVEAKDPYTRGHSERVNRLSMEIGRALGLPEDELMDLYWGSLLHDVGKIGIPDAVLCKPSRLTKDEYTFIMVHPERSYEILRHVDQLKNALPGARHHQEMWDGKGYPHGLKGERIPLHARIMAVADTYDSITSSRAYRPGRSHEVAMAEIERVSGTQLDPAMVKVFQELCAAEPEWLAQFRIRRDAPAAG